MENGIEKVKPETLQIPAAMEMLDADIDICYRLVDELSCRLSTILRVPEQPVDEKAENFPQMVALANELTGYGQRVARINEALNCILSRLEL